MHKEKKMAEERSLAARTVFPLIRLTKMAEKTLTEGEILKAVIAGNKEAYQAIVQLYMKSAYYIALGIVHNHQDALDISQESFIRAFRKIKKYDPSRPFFPWFYRLMKNLCLDHLKRSQRLKEVPLEENQVLKDDTEDRELKKVLWQSIEELPFKQREVVILRYFRQCSYQEISEITGKPVGTVMSSLYYAKKKLKDIIGRYL